LNGDHIVFFSKYCTKTFKVQHDCPYAEPARASAFLRPVTYLYEGGCEIVVEVLVNLLLVDVGQQARDRLEHEDQHQQDCVLNPKIRQI
jgi:hypothetical protein